MPPQFSCVPLRSTSENCAVLPCFSDFGCFPTAHFLTFPKKENAPSTSTCQLFQIHGSKLKLHPVRYLSQASVLCITHRVFFLGIGKGPSNGLFAPLVKIPVKFGFSPQIVPANIVKKLPSQRCFKPLLIPIFNFPHKHPTLAFTDESGYTLGFRRKIAHNGLHAETGAFPPPATAQS